MNWADPALWYNLMNPWGPSDDFYLDLVMSAESVLDVGCGTGALLHGAREAGHSGRLCGLDPDPAMLNQARARSDIEWVLADAASASWNQEFQLAVMTGHAFQMLVSDKEIRESLRAIRAALVEGGRFAFETRHPQARAWEGWNGSYQIRNPDGGVARLSYQVFDVTGDVVQFSETLSGQWWNGGHTNIGKLRFLSPDALTAHLDKAGFLIEQQFGDWQRRPIDENSAEIITIARRR